MSRSIGLAMIGGLLLASCSSPSVGGAINGTAYQMQSSLFATSVAADGSSNTTLFLSNNEDACSQGQNDGLLKDLQLALISLEIVAPSGMVVAPDVAGTFELAPGQLVAGSKVAAAEAASIGTCLFGNFAQASGGSVLLTHVEVDNGKSPTRLVGSVDLEFPDGGSLKGSFDASNCGGTFDPIVDLCEE